MAPFCPLLTWKGTLDDLLRFPLPMVCEREAVLDVTASLLQ